MPVDLRCERCNKKIASVPYEKIREYVQSNGETCTPCLEKEQALRDFYLGRRKSFDRRMDKLIETALEELKQEITRMASGAEE
jgi:protein-arginine kinase activator protein McsA